MDYQVMFYLFLMLEPLILALTYIITDPVWRCKILSRVFRGHYGIVLLRSHSSNVIMLTANLKKDLLHLGDDVYALENGMMANVKHPDDKKDLLKSNRFVGGVPLIEFDIDDMVPVEISTMKLDSKFRARLPGLVGSNIKKEISIAEAEAFDKNKELLKKLLFVVIIMMVVAIGIGGVTYMNLGNQQLTLQQIFNMTRDLNQTGLLGQAVNGTLVGG